VDIRSATPAQSSRPGSTIVSWTIDSAGLEPEHAERRRRPLAVLVLVRVRGVVGGHHVDGAVGQPLAERLDVALERSGGLTL
jgi:hypothetical protein